MTEMLNQASGPADGGAQARPVTREEWLHAAIEAFRPRFGQIGMPLPDKIHISVGFGYGARAESRYILAQCWARRASADQVNHVFISPVEGDPAAMLGHLLHELIHAADDCASGHRGAFAEAATRLGLEGPMTATRPGPGLAFEMLTLAAALGPLPHARLDPATASVPVPAPRPGSPAAPGGRVHSGPGKQTTRMIKLTAAGCCGYTVRTTARWLAEGDPQCPHGTPMTRD